MDNVTLGSPFIRNLLEGAVLQGHSGEQILQMYGISPLALKHQRFRVSTQKFAELSAGVIDLLQDEALGMLIQPLPANTYEILFRSTYSANRIIDALRIWAQCCSLLSPLMDVSFSEDDTQVTLTLNCEKRPEITGNTFVEGFFITLQRYLCWLANKHIPVKRVDFQTPAPSYSDDYLFGFYGAPIFFGQTSDSLCLERKFLNEPCLRDRKELDDWLKVPASQVITRSRHRASTGVAIRHWMEKMLVNKNDDISLEAAATHMKLTPQTLRRKLKKGGLSFAQLKEDSRRDFAIHLLATSDARTEEVAYQVGFSDGSTFARAFKKWTGLTPLAYRKLTSSKL